MRWWRWGCKKYSEMNGTTLGLNLALSLLKKEILSEYAGNKLEQF